MRVVMERLRIWQDAGMERPLEVGQAYDLPDVVAESLIVTGAAVKDLVAAVELADERPPELKPIIPPERKESRHAR